MDRELNMEKGIRESIYLLNKVDEMPKLVAVYGQPNSGKSYFIDKLAKHLENQGLSVDRNGGLDQSTFEAINDMPNTLCDVLAFHCGWEREDYKLNDGVFGHEDPNILARKFCGRNINMNVGIYNPDFYEYIEGDYNMVICNPDSVKKKRLIL